MRSCRYRTIIPPQKTISISGGLRLKK